MTTPRIVIVTGANRGIGQAICNLILNRQPAITPLKLFATSRTGSDLGLVGTVDGQHVLYPKLDISSHDSIKAFAGEVQQHGPVHVLINNAGVNLDAEYGYENAKKTLDVNYRGTLDMCSTFTPLLSKTGRIVNLSSVASSMKPYDEAVRQRFRDPNATLEDLDQIGVDFLATVQSGTEEANGFGPPQRSYSVSKGLVNALTANLARENPGLNINCCCPGWVSTDMGRIVGNKPPKTPEQGARIPVHLAFDEIDGVTGRYWANDSIRGKEEGKVQEW